MSEQVTDEREGMIVIRKPVRMTLDRIGTEEDMFSLTFVFKKDEGFPYSVEILMESETVNQLRDLLNRTGKVNA